MINNFAKKKSIFNRMVMWILNLFSRNELILMKGTYNGQSKEGITVYFLRLTIMYEIQYVLSK